MTNGFEEEFYTINSAVSPYSPQPTRPLSGSHYVNYSRKCVVAARRGALLSPWPRVRAKMTFSLARDAKVQPSLADAM